MKTKTRHKPMPGTLVSIIADGLDSICDGRGFSKVHLDAVNLANASPDLLAACKATHGAIVLGNGRTIDWTAIADQLGAAISCADSLTVA